MSIEIPPNPNSLPYFVVDFCHTELEMQWTTKEEKEQLDPHSRDAHFDLANGLWSIKHYCGNSKGSPHPFPLGPVRWDFCVLILLMAPEFRYLHSCNDEYATLARIQRAFGKPPESRNGKDSTKQGKGKKLIPEQRGFWFQVERIPSYRVRLNPERTFRIITNENLDGMPNECIVQHTNVQR